MSFTLLCVHPHPDDESIACGGVLARYADEGIRTVVVTCTGGEEGDNLAGIDLGTEELVDHRRRELADALATLGVHASHQLGYRDSGMVGTPPNDHADSFHRVDVEVAATALAGIIRAERPQVVISDDAQGSYGHPDHIKANRVTLRAVALAADPGADVAGTPWQVAKRYVHTFSRGRLFELHQAMRAAGLASPFGENDFTSPDDVPLGLPDELVTTAIDVHDVLDRKQAAMGAHKSQIGEDSFFLNTPPQLQGSAFGVEEFALEAGDRGVGPGPEADLFAGLREGAAGSAAGLEAGSAASSGSGSERPDDRERRRA